MGSTWTENGSALGKTLGSMGGGVREDGREEGAEQRSDLRLRRAGLSPWRQSRVVQRRPRGNEEDLKV